MRENYLEIYKKSNRKLSKYFIEILAKHGVWSADAFWQKKKAQDFELWKTKYISKSMLSIASACTQFQQIEADSAEIIYVWSRR